MGLAALPVPDALPKSRFPRVGRAQRFKIVRVRQMTAVVEDLSVRGGTVHQVPGGVAVAPRASPTQREVDHRAPQQRGGERVAGGEGIGQRSEDLIGVAVDLLAAGVDQVSRQRQVGGLQAIGQCFLDRCVGEDDPARGVLGLDVLEVGQQLEVTAQRVGTEPPLEAGPERGAQVVLPAERLKAGEMRFVQFRRVEPRIAAVAGQCGLDQPQGVFGATAASSRVAAEGAMVE